MIESENIVQAVRWLGTIRTRIMVMLLVVVLSATAVYCVSDPLLKLITEPLKGQPLYFMTPVDGVMAKIKVAVFGGILLAFPVLSYMIVSTFSFRLSQEIRKKIYFLLIPLASFLFIGGTFFAYKMIMPTTVDFLLSSGEGVLNPMISGSGYVSFISFFLISVGLVFELPLVMVALARVGLIRYRMLAKKRKVAIMVILIALAALSPTPDAFSLLVETIPVILLYEASIWMIYALERKNMRGAGM